VKLKFRIEEKGGPGSGHRGHIGRPGKVGGSLPGSGYTVRKLRYSGDLAYIISPGTELPKSITNVVDSGMALAVIYNNGKWEIASSYEAQHDDLKSGLDIKLGQNIAGYVTKNPNVGGSKYLFALYDYTKGASRDYIREYYGDAYRSVLNKYNASINDAKNARIPNVYISFRSYEAVNDLIATGW